ncbi:MAG: hypothetical protein QW046_05610 [Candidatus Micrarchaeaceae archaeon]
MGYKLGLIEKLLGGFWTFSSAMVKYGFNAKWYVRDAAYKNMLKAVLRVLLRLAVVLGGSRRQKRETC